jgi:hypothetical protein
MILYVTCSTWLDLLHYGQAECNEESKAENVNNLHRVKVQK